MLETWDYLVIGFYFLFTMSIGVVCKKVAKNTSDYFRGGGSMLWWMTGMSGIASGLSAWTFTAAASRVTQMGFFIVALFALWIPAYLVLYFLLADRFRQMRIITVADGIKRRFGRFTEQFWVWIQVPGNLFIGAVWLMTVSVFMSAALGINVSYCIIGLGIVVSMVSVFAGAWSVIASDFIQMSIIIIGVFVVFFRAVTLPEVGGVSGFFEQIPDTYTNFNLSELPSIWIAFLLVSAVMRFMQAADLSKEGAKFLSAKDGREAKKATLVIMAGTLIVPAMAFIPVMIGSFVLPELGTLFPNMEKPAEGAYMAIAAYVLPPGMVGLIVCAMFAASISSIDTALNRNAGFFVRNFYAQFVRPMASDREQLIIGRIMTLVLAAIVVGLSLFLSHNREMGLFELSNLIFSLLIPPMIVPAVFGLLYKRTPYWSGWSTVLVGFATAAVAKLVVKKEWVAEHIWGVSRELNSMESGDMTFVYTVLMTVGVGTAWFFFTSLFYNRQQEAKKESIEALFKDMRTPIDHVVEKSVNQDAVQYHIMGVLSMIFGLVLMLGFFIPNELRDRMLFVWCGGAIFAVGAFLYSIYRKKSREATKVLPDCSE